MAITNRYSSRPLAPSAASPSRPTATYRLKSWPPAECPTSTIRRRPGNRVVPDSSANNRSRTANELRRLAASFPSCDRSPEGQPSFVHTCSSAASWSSAVLNRGAITRVAGPFPLARAAAMIRAKLPSSSRFKPCTTRTAIWTCGWAWRSGALAMYATDRPVEKVRRSAQWSFSAAGTPGGTAIKIRRTASRTRTPAFITISILPCDVDASPPRPEPSARGRATDRQPSSTVARNLPDEIQDREPGPARAGCPAGYSPRRDGGASPGRPSGAPA